MDINEHGNSCNSDDSKCSLQNFKEIKKENDPFIKIKVEYDPDDKKQTEKTTFIRTDTMFFKSGDSVKIKEKFDILEAKIEDESDISSFSNAPELYTKSSITYSPKVKNYTCAVCNTYVSWNKRRHFSSHFGKNIVTCSLCGKLYKDKNEFSLHYTKHQVKTKNTLSFYSKPPRFLKATRAHIRGTIFKCDKCSLNIMSEEAYQSHVINHSKNDGRLLTENENLDVVVKDEIDIVYNNLEIKEENQVESSEIPEDLMYCYYVVPEVFRCETCSKQFADQTTLESHQRRRHGVKLIKCKFCLEQFTKKSDVNNHMKIHDPYFQRPYKCHICCKRYKRKSVLNVHMKCHKAKQYTCELCCRNFTYKHNLDVHRCFKTYKNILCCDFCEYIFKDAVTFNKHTLECIVMQTFTGLLNGIADMAVTF